jgi:hypothetical protein
MVRKWTRTGPLRLKSLRFAGLFPAKSREQGTIAASATLAALISRRNLLGCHGFSSAKEGLGRPQIRIGSSPLSNGT